MLCKLEVPCSVPKKLTLHCIMSEMIQWIPKLLKISSVSLCRLPNYIFFSGLPTGLVKRKFKVSAASVLFLKLIFMNKVSSTVNYRYY